MLKHINNLVRGIQRVTGNWLNKISKTLEKVLDPRTINDKFLCSCVPFLNFSLKEFFSNEKKQSIKPLLKEKVYYIWKTVVVPYIKFYALTSVIMTINFFLFKNAINLPLVKWFAFLKSISEYELGIFLIFVGVAIVLSLKKIVTNKNEKDLFTAIAKVSKGIIILIIKTFICIHPILKFFVMFAIGLGILWLINKLIEKYNKKLFIN